MADSASLKLDILTIRAAPAIGRFTGIIDRLSPLSAAQEESMSAQSMADAWAPVTALHRAQVYKATWGHLAPKKNKAYRGHIVFALGCFGGDGLNPTVLSCDLDIDSSPWFFDAMIEFLQSLKGEEGGVYRWDGTFRNYEFKGSVRRLRLES